MTLRYVFLRLGTNTEVLDSTIIQLKSSIFVSASSKCGLLNLCKQFKTWLPTAWLINFCRNIMQDNILVGGCCQLFLLESPKSMSVLPFLKESSDYNMWTTPDTDLLINIYLWVFEVFNNEHDRNSLLLFRITLKLKSLKAVIKYMMKSNALVRPPSQYDTAPAHLKQTLTSQTVLQGHRDSVNALWFDVYLHDNEWRVWIKCLNEWKTK